MRLTVPFFICITHMCLSVIPIVAEEGGACYSRERMDKRTVVSRLVDCDDPKAEKRFHSTKDVSMSEMLAHADPSEWTKAESKLEPKATSPAASNPDSVKATEPVMTCPPNMTPGNCSKCIATCADPSGTVNCSTNCSATEIQSCICPTSYLLNGSNCIRQEDCGCYMGGHGVLANGTAYVNDNCTERNICIDGRLVLEEGFRCGSNARCLVTDGIRDCYCDDGFLGDGLTCEHYVDCYDAYTAGNTEDGLYLIKPMNWSGEAFNVSCLMSTHGGGWTVFQRRTDTQAGREVSFYRDWASYKEGFGSLSGAFWLGNEKIHHLTQQRAYTLRVDLVTAENVSVDGGEWSTFSVGEEDDNYRLRLRHYSGNVSGLYWNHGAAFSTYDRDNDVCVTFNCAEKHKGGWWYWRPTDLCTSNEGRIYCVCYCFSKPGADTRCTNHNPNGIYDGINGETIFWRNKLYTGYCRIRFFDMKIRPTN